MSDKILIDYDLANVYAVTPVNTVGPTTSLTLRTVTAHTDSDCKYVRKFGSAYEITQVTDIEDPVDVDMKFWVYAIDGTLLGSRVGGGAFVAGSTLSTAQACYLKISATGACTALTTILIDTDVDAGGIDFICPAEVLTSGMSINLYLSSTTSTYYDSTLMYGGSRHTPDGTEALPYFKIQDGLDACTSYFPTCTVLDSATYDEELTIDGGWCLQAALGQTPTITCGVGARTSRTVQHDGNNLDTAYVATTGSDTTGTGTWALPYATIQYAITNKGSRTYINIKTTGVYPISANVAISASIEPIYGISVSIVPSASVANYMFTFGTGSYFICGFTINAQNKFTNGVYMGAGNTHTAKFSDNTIKSAGAMLVKIESKADGHTLQVKNNLIYSAGTNGIEIAVAHTGTYTVQNNIVYSCLFSGIYLALNASGKTVTLQINNNLCRNNGNGGIEVVSAADPTFGTSSISNNTCVYNSSGITANTTFTFFANTCYYNTAKDLLETGGACTATYTCYETNTGFALGAGNFTTAPEFVDSAENNYGYKVTSPCLKTDGVEDDVGCKTGLINVGASGVTINGFYLSGRDSYFKGIYKYGSTDYTGLTVKWCSIYDFRSMGIDDYSGANTETIISNNKIHSNGNGLNFPFGCSEVSYNEIYLNDIYGVYRNKSITTFDHNVFFGNGVTGYYLPVTASGGSVENSIFLSNGAYGINSLVTVDVFYSCIADYVSTFVDYLTSGRGNITDNPLFINENDGTENFRVKTIAGGYLFNSPCYETADDGYSMGAYLETYTLTDSGWKSYQLEHEPTNMNVETVLKGQSKLESNFGSVYIRGSNYKMIFPLEWSTNQATTATQGKKIKYFISKIPTAGNGLTRAGCAFRLWFLPDTHIDSGTGVISATGKTITDTGSAWIEDEVKGYHIGVKFATVTGATLNTTTKQITLAGAGWTTDQWVNYSYRSGQRSFAIMSNTATILQVSDPNGYLTSGMTDGFIEDYFKCSGNTATVLSVLDPYSRLITGTYGYYIGFVKTYVTTTSYRYQQPNYDIGAPEWNAGYTIIFEEE